MSAARDNSDYPRNQFQHQEQQSSECQINQSSETQRLTDMRHDAGRHFLDYAGGTPLPNEKLLEKIFESEETTTHKSLEHWISRSEINSKKKGNGQARIRSTVTRASTQKLEDIVSERSDYRLKTCSRPDTEGLSEIDQATSTPDLDGDLGFENGERLHEYIEFRIQEKVQVAGSRC